MMLKRWLSGLFMGAIVFAVVWFGDPTFSIFIAAIAIVGSFEFFPLIGISKKHPITIFGTIGVLLFIGMARFDDMKYTALLLTASVTLPLIWLVFQSDIKHAATNWAWLIVGILYLGWMLSHFIPLRQLDSGRDWIILAILGNVASDTIAFHCGLKWGRHRMAPRISPAKSWEGAIAGFIGTVAIVILLGTYLPTLKLPYWQSLDLGVLIGFFAPLGDLAESLIKRSTGIKDSGNCMPGHGGILDRLDSILFTIVVVYYYVTWVIV